MPMTKLRHIKTIRPLLRLTGFVLLDVSSSKEPLPLVSRPDLDDRHHVENHHQPGKHQAERDIAAAPRFLLGLGQLDELHQNQPPVPEARTVTKRSIIKAEKIANR